MEDRWSRERADRLIHSVGRCALEAQLSQEPVPDQPASLMEAIHQGNRAMVRANALADPIERSIKAGMVLTVELEINEAGSIMQHGQTDENISRNALLYASDSPQIRERSEAETRNTFRLQDNLRAGKLDDNYFVVISRAADNMSETDMDEAGFFTETMSCVIQVTTLKDGRLITESAFVAGKADRHAERHDQATVEKLGHLLVVDFTGKTATEIIDTPLLIPKDMLPDGAVDMVKLYDEAAGGTFFGEAKPQQDYRAYLEFCRVRQKTFEPIADKIADQLLREKDLIHTPLAAIRRLHQLSQRYMVDYAIEHEDINPRVFGDVAAGHIEAARIHRAQGDELATRRARNSAQATAKSNSCPSAWKRDQEAETENQTGENDTESPEYDSKDGKIRCIKCRQYVPKAEVVKKDCWECPKCSHKVDICTGAVLNEGEPQKIEPAKSSALELLKEWYEAVVKIEQTAA